MIGDGYVADVRQRLNAYRSRLRPRGNVSVEDLEDAIHALNGQAPSPGQTKTALKKMLSRSIKRVFTPGGKPLSKMKKGELMSLASKLQKYSSSVGGYPLDLSESRDRYVLDDEFPDPKARAPRKDKGVERPHRW